MNFTTKLPRVSIVLGNHDYVVQRCKGKRVLHFGCVDAGLLEERFEKGALLHQKLAAVATELWGFDIDEDGIRFLQSKGVPNLVIGDATQVKALEPLKPVAFDVLVAGEIVEHLLNPGLFLDALKTLMRPGQTELIITVPNAFGVDTLVALLRGIEYVHPDHNYWFSYSTITTLIKKRGYQIKEVVAYSHQLVPFWYRPEQTGVLRYLFSLVKRLLVRGLYRLTPFWGDGIIVVAMCEESKG